MSVILWKRNLQSKWLKTSRDTARIPELDVLRALSALGVIFYHYCIFFFTDQDFSSKLSCCPPLDFSDYDFIALLKEFPFDLGRFFVAFFLLLSGFLIPDLVKRYPERQDFLKNRLFRLWPTYAVGLLVNMGFIWGACLYHQIPFPHDFGSILASFLCLRDFLGYPFITGVVWTFEIEIKFCLFCLIVYPLLKKTDPLKILFLNGFFFLSCFVITSLLYEADETYQWVFNIAKILSRDLRFFCFIFLGFFLSLFYKKKITPKNWIMLSFTSIFLFFIETSVLYKTGTLLKYMISYTPAWFFFIIYTWPKKTEIITKTQSSAFTVLANISYPLYLIHAVPGYILTYILYDYGVPVLRGMFIGFILSLLFATLLHNRIEKPCRSWKRI